MIDLRFGENQFRFKYPQEVPHIMPIMNPLGQNSQMNIVILQRLDKKFKKVGRGNITIFAKDLMNDRFSFETMVYLDLFEKRISERNPTTDILKAYGNKGQIYLKVQLLDIVLDDLPRLQGGKGGIKGGKKSVTKGSPKKKSNAIVTMLKDNVEMVPIVKDNVQSLKTNKYKDFTSKENNLLKDIKAGNINEEDDLYEDIIEEEEIKEEFFDQCSNISISVIDGIDENRIEIENMNIGIDTLLEKIKSLTYNRLDEIIPQDPEDMKIFIEDYANKVGVISQSYFRNLKTLSEINNGLKFQAKDFYEKYKELKKSFVLERRDLKSKLIAMDNQTAANIEENNRLHSKLEDLRTEVQFFSHEIGAEDDAVYKEEDYQVMLAIINNVTRNGGDVYDGLNEKERKELQKVMNKYQQDLELIENAIPTRLEAVINDLFLNKKVIKSVAVSETEIPDTYKFDNKTVTLYMQNNVLKVKEKGFASFEDWIVTYFPKVRLNGGFAQKPGARSSIGGSGAKPGVLPKKSIVGTAKPKPKPR